MEFLNFTAFCGRKESNDLFNDPFMWHWIRMDTYVEGVNLDDDMSMYLMGGEL